MYYSLASSLPLVLKPKHTASSYLVFQISLAGDGIQASDNVEPLLHIGRWDAHIDFDNGSYMGFPLSGYDGPEFSIEKDVLMRWQGDTQPDSWLYSLQLSEINTLHDVHVKILEPVRTLLLGARVEQALPVTLTGLVRYIAMDEGKGQFRTAFCG